MIHARAPAPQRRGRARCRAPLAPDGRSGRGGTAGSGRPETARRGSARGLVVPASRVRSLAGALARRPLTRTALSAGQLVAQPAASNPRTVDGQRALQLHRLAQLGIDAHQEDLSLDQRALDAAVEAFFDLPAEQPGGFEAAADLLLGELELRLAAIECRIPSTKYLIN